MFENNRFRHVSTRWRQKAGILFSGGYDISSGNGHTAYPRRHETPFRKRNSLFPFAEFENLDSVNHCTSKEISMEIKRYLLVQWLTESRFGKTKFGIPIEKRSLMSAGIGCTGRSGLWPLKPLSHSERLGTAEPAGRTTVDSVVSWRALGRRLCLPWALPVSTPAEVHGPLKTQLLLSTPWHCLVCGLQDVRQWRSGRREARRGEQVGRGRRHVLSSRRSD